jgi:glycosyltransferase involved in cell wall biosynthesis
MGGGEKCLEVLCRRWPQASLYTLLHRKGSVSPSIEALQPRPSWLQRIPGIFRFYRYLLPLMPQVVERWQLPFCDLVVSFSHCVAKSVHPPQRDNQPVPHVCYCFTPMRYAWHMREAYFRPGQMHGIKARLLDALLTRLRNWDRQTADRVSHFVAISQTVRARIAECYSRDSEVIYPPVDTEYYTPIDKPRQDYFLIVSAFAPYKRLDLAITVCNQRQLPLVVIGSGQDEARLRALAGPTVTLLGWQPDSVIRDHLRSCKALLFPGEEDFGIVPLEAHACGTPVIALGRGGATETVIPPGNSQIPTGLWFAEPTVEALHDALGRFSRLEADLDPRAARSQAVRFSTARFASELFQYLDRVLHGSVPQRRAA